MTAAIKFLGIRGIIGLAVALALSVALGLQVHKTHQEHASAVSCQLKYDGEHAAFQQTIINYSKAAADARQADAANIARVRAQQAAINERSQNEYEARLADARARAERLSRGTTAANPGSPGPAPVPGAVGPSGSADGPAAEDGFSVADRLTATEQAIQLDELIKWVRRNLTVDFGNSSQSSRNASPSPNSKR